MKVMRVERIALAVAIGQLVVALASLIASMLR